MKNHRVCVRVTQPGGVKTDVLKASEHKRRKRLLNFLLGDEMNVLVISPGATVNEIEIIENQLNGGV